ncbi:MAG: copper amine oxidase N-terminal domain-containing protein, partial [Syntrophomonadaceae bacterium]|nr:copper amine oxidase N-terminal domain-containing protein [Syntrophomonadaceae bacterium]
GDTYYYSLGDVEEFDVGGGSDVPELTTSSASSIKSDSAVLNGKLTSLGDGKKITEYGFYYGTTSSASTKKKVGDDDDRLKKGDTFDFKLSGLKPDTKYYFKSYAKSSEGIGYGSVKSFTTAEDKEDTPVVTTTSSVFTIGSSYYTLNGSSQAMDAAPYIKNSRTYMPIRYVGYAMGLTDAQIQWYEATRTVILTKGSTTVVLVIGSPTMFVNGQARVMDVAPEITNSRTCLPIAWVAAAFGHTAVWNGATQQVTIAGVTVPGVSKGELKLSRSSLTLEPGDDATITGTLSVDIDDVDYSISGDRVVTVKTTITGTSFKATIKANSGADDGDEATITFTVTDNNGIKYEAELDVAVEDDSGSEVEVSTSKATSITKDSARLNGAVTDDGDLDIKRFGFYYGTNKSQVSKGEDGSADYSKGKGSESKFYLDLDDLDSNKKYYFMAYAVDEDSDITYGKVLDFTTKK